MAHLEGKTAIVTGAAQGIGASIAQGLAAEGARVIVADVLDGEPVAEAICSAGGEAIAVHNDVTDENSIAALVDTASERFGGIDVLVNNAALFGKLPQTPFADIPLDQWDTVMRVNTRGIWQLIKAIVPAMEARGGGSIVNIATNRVYTGYPGLLHYDASKGAVIAMSRALAMELGDANIRVNTVCPGLTMSENVLQKEGIKENSAVLYARRAIKREQQPEDLVGPVIFFASAMSGLVTGQSLVVDGGAILR